MSPMAPAYPCAEQGCPSQAATRGRCLEHAKQIDQRRGTSADRGYGRAWQKAAAAFKVRNPLCGMRDGHAAPVMSRCHEQGITTAAYQVDHVIPHRGDRALFDNQANWQSLCRSCGSAKSRAGL